MVLRVLGPGFNALGLRALTKPSAAGRHVVADLVSARRAATGNQKFLK